MKNRCGMVVLFAAVAVTLPLAALADGDIATNAGQFYVALSGDQEVPAVSTAARGKALIQIGPAVDVAGTGGKINYQIGWEQLQGDVVQAHLHFGARGTNGGVIAFLCSNLNSTPLNVPLCPQEGFVTGSIGADQILGPDGQGIAPGELGEVIRALRAGLVYLNVHTSDFPGGEIRGQVQRRYWVDTQADPRGFDGDASSGGFSNIQGR